jgi:peroxiredoxin
MNAVGVSVDQEEADAKQFVKDNSLTFRNAFAFGSDNAADVLDNYGLYGVPTIYVLNKGGSVSWMHVGEAPEDTVRAELAKVGVK